MTLRFYIAAGIALVLAISLQADKILKKTLQQRVQQSDIIINAEVLQVRATGSMDAQFKFERAEADCAVRQVFYGVETNRALKVAFFIKPRSSMREAPEPEGLKTGKAYILFLRHGKAGLSLADPWDSCLEVSPSYGIWDEDFKNDPEALKNTNSKINGVPYVTLTHEALVEKLRVAWEKKSR